MADNIEITPGSGKTIATDEVGSPGPHYQRIKLASGADNSTEMIDGDTANGLDVDVTRLPALPAGTNNIGDVDVLSLPALPAGNNNIGDVDIASLVTATNRSTTGSLGALNDTVALAVPGCGTAAVSIQGTFTATVLFEGTVDGTNWFQVYSIGQVSGDLVLTRTSPTQVLMPCAGMAQIRVRCSAYTSGTIDIVISAGAGSHLVQQASPLPPGDNNIGNIDVLTLPNVTLAAGTNTNEVVGDVAHGITFGSNPVPIAGVAVNTDDTAPPIRNDAEGDVTVLATDRDGSLFVRPHGPQIWSYHIDGSAALTDASVHAAPGAGLSLYVTDIVISLGAATALNVFFEEGSTKVLGPFYLEAVNGRGLHIKFGTPKKITANTALTVTSSAAVAHSIDVTGFTAQG